MRICCLGAVDGHMLMQQQQQPPSQPRPAFNTAPTFAPKPQPSLYSVTPILNQHAEEEEPDVIRYVYYPAV